MTSDSKELDAIEVDFDVVKENWNKYQLPQGIVMRTRSPLIKIFKAKGGNKLDQGTYLTAGSSVFDVLCPLDVKGTPSEDTSVKPEDIVEDDVDFKVISEDWSEYLLLPDNLILKTKPVIVKVSKTRKFNQFGDPIFSVQSNLAIKITEKKP